MKTKITRETETEMFDIDVEFHYESGSRDYFSRSFGNWLPGDPAEFYVLEARRADTDEEVELTAEEEAEVESRASEILEDLAAEARISAYEDRMDYGCRMYNEP
jgi:hypothetical protein